jgi:hypothetical protein
MEIPRDPLQDLMRRPLDPSVPLVLKRIALRLLMLLVFSSLPMARIVGFWRMFAILAAVNAVGCVVWALLRREQPGGRGLTHWDEALVMVLLCLLGSIKA